MPPACRFTREQIVAAALAITRERGFDAVTARAIADTLHSSSKVIFSAFSGMDDLLAATIDAADAQYRAYSADFVRNSADPPYKAVGTAYIRFARNEPNLFHLLYMRDRRREDHSGDAENIAVLCASGQQNWDDALISRMLTDGFEGIKSRFQKNEQ